MSKTDEISIISIYPYVLHKIGSPYQFFELNQKTHYLGATCKCN